MEYFQMILDSDVAYWFFLVSGIFLTIIGFVMFYGIIKRGKVLLISSLLKNKQYDNETLLDRYKIQAIYTSLFGAIFVAFILTDSLSRLGLLIYMFIVGICDGLYDYFAIKKATKSQ